MHVKRAQFHDLATGEGVKPGINQPNHIEAEGSIRRYSGAMILSRSVRSWIALLALVSFAVPAIGAHLHLCLDEMGSEPPASLHVSDVGAHHPEDSDLGHRDVDVSLDREALAKKIAASLDVPKVLPAALVLFVEPAAIVVDYPRGPPSPIVSASRYRILPPLRAPPV